MLRRCLHLQTHASIHILKMMTLTMCMVNITISLGLTFLFSQWCGNVDVKTPLVSAESIGGRRILLNKPSALKTNIMSLWLSPHVDLECDEEQMKSEDSQKQLITQGLQSGYRGIKEMVPKTTLKMAFHTSHHSLEQMTLVLNKLDVNKRTHWSLWRKALDEDRWYTTSIAKTCF